MLHVFCFSVVQAELQDTGFAKRLCFLLIRNVILIGKILSSVTLVLAQSCAGLMRTGLDPRNLSGRLCYIPHTKKHVYREMYTFLFCLLGWFFLISLIFLKLWPRLQ